MPTVLRPQTQIPSQENGCFPCLNTGFLNSQPGLCKLGEVLFGSICLGLIITFGTPVWLILGPSYALFLTSCSSALLGSSVLLFCYLISPHTFRVLRTTLLETVQNTLSLILYIAASTFLLIQTTFILWPMYLIIPYFQAYPAMMTAGVFGSVCAVIHGIDAVSSYRAMKGK